MKVWLVRSGWQGNGLEAVFVEADTEQGALDAGFALFRAAAPDRSFTRLSAEPLKLNEITECDGWQY